MFYHLSSSSSYNVNFCSKSNLLPDFLFKVSDSKLPVTKSHFDNMFYKTNINDLLRHPESAIYSTLDYMNYSAMQNQSVHGLSDMTKMLLPRNANIKDQIKEDPIALKNKYNKEFESLKPTEEKIDLYRGISGISDSEYERFKSYKKHTIQVPDVGYSYMSRDINEAKNYAVGPLTKGNSVLFEIEIPPKSRISELEGILPPSPTSPEWPYPRVKHEITVPAGSYYEVVKDSQVDEKGVLHVFLKYLDRW